MSLEALRNLGCQDANLIRLGDTVKAPSLRQISASWKFGSRDLADDYDFFIFSGNWAHYLKEDLISGQANALLKLAASTWIKCHRRFGRISVEAGAQLMAK